MVTRNKTAFGLENANINVRIKLSALWVVLMLLYIYPDILTIMQPGHIQQIMAGELDGNKITQTLLLAGTISMSISSIMVFLCLVLKPQINRWVNMLLGIGYIGMVAAYLPGNWAYYLCNSCLEIIVSLLIVWHAWTWPRQEGVPAQQSNSADA